MWSRPASAIEITMVRPEVADALNSQYEAMEFKCKGGGFRAASWETFAPDVPWCWRSRQAFAVAEAQGPCVGRCCAGMGLVF